MSAKWSPDEDFLKKDFMVKRSMMKSFTFENYKSRWFILTEDTLGYYDGSLPNGPGRLKNQVDLATVKAVESVEKEALEKDNVFQVMYGEGEYMTLYIQAQTGEMRTEWIDTLRSTCESAGATFETKYHPGVWQVRSRRFSCCDQIDKRAPGCRPGFTQPERHHAHHENSVSALSPKHDPLPPIPQSTAPPRNRPEKPQLPKPKPDENKKKVIALYDYDGAEHDDLNLCKGDEYEVLDDSKDHWWKARDKYGKVGFLPSNYVQVVTNEGLERYDWYYKSISRQQSEAVLREENREGCFLVRDSSASGMYTLSLFSKETSDGMVRHYHIKLTGKKEYFLSDKHTFKAIPELIYYHKHNCAGLAVRLRSPPTDRSSSQPATAGFGHDKWEIDPVELVMGELLGKGQFGTVHKAKFRGSIDVAVKSMKEGAMSEDDFIAEAQTMKTLQHQHLVQLYGVCTKHRPIYIITEYMKHGALNNYLKRHRGTLAHKSTTLLEMCIQVCSAMKYLEEQKFIHRDLAARNCLVGDSATVKVADFGLARFVLDDEYTSSSGTKFPIKWSSPEVLSYTKFSSKSDMWAFGVLMWEIFTCGEMPYGKMRNMDVVEQVVQRRMKLEKPQNCPLAVYQKMRECWHQEPDDRPSFEKMLPLLTQLTEDKDYVS